MLSCSLPIVYLIVSLLFAWLRSSVLHQCEQRELESSARHKSRTHSDNQKQEEKLTSVLKINYNTKRTLFYEGKTDRQTHR